MNDTSTKRKEPEQYFCRDQCGRSIDVDKVSQWQRGEISGKYRCPNCRQALEAVRYIGSVNDQS